MSASLQSAQLNYYNAQHDIGSVVDDTPVAIRIAHPGDEAVTSVTVNTAASIVLIDADGTTTIDITAAATDTVGEVVDYINALDNWSAKALDSLRADTVATSQLVDGAITSSNANGETVWDALQDTSVLLAMTYRCTYNRNVDLARPQGIHRVKLQEFSYNLDINAASANGVRVYEWDPVQKTETQIWRAVSVDATLTTHNWASGEGIITAGWGKDLIVRVIDGTSLTDAAGNFLQAAYIKE